MKTINPLLARLVVKNSKPRNLILIALKNRSGGGSRGGAGAHRKSRLGDVLRQRDLEWRAGRRQCDHSHDTGDACICRTRRTQRACGDNSQHLNITMKASPLVAWWAARPLREKALVIVVTTAALLAGGDALLTAPLEKRVKRAAGEQVALETKLRKLKEGQTATAAETRALRQQEAHWRERLAAVQTTATLMHRRVADAARLPETLRAVIATVGSARLLELDLAADTGEAAGPGAAASGSNGARRLYRLPITLKVSGTYDELHTLLTQIERHAEALQWSALSLDNAEWPAIQLTLKAHVLSHDPRWGSAI